MSKHKKSTKAHAFQERYPAEGGHESSLVLSNPGQTEGRSMDHYGFLGRLAYRASYGLSFGVVYPAAMLARAIPRENAAVYGLHDGSIAARDEAATLWNRSAASGEAEPIVQAS